MSHYQVMNMNPQLINWYTRRHPGWGLAKNNQPEQVASRIALERLQTQIIGPLEMAFGPVCISYGFTSFELLKLIKKHSPAHIAPELDQHAAYEVNSKGNRICKRDGAAVDFYIEGYENQMQLIARYVIDNLEFDRMYVYGNSRPLHISVGPDSNRFVQLITTKTNGKRHPGKRDFGEAALELFEISEK